MIDQCDPSIATWSSDGDTFAIKDVDEFAKVSSCFSSKPISCDASLLTCDFRALLK
jgi:hypothetical protein